MQKQSTLKLFPKPHYPPLSRGKISARISFEDICEKVKEPVERIILFTNLSMRSKKYGEKKCTLVTSLQFFYFINGNAVKTYSYMDVEFIVPRGDTDLELHLYAVDSNKKRIKFLSMESNEARDRMDYIFTRQLAMSWQDFFETKLPVPQPDYYNYHAYIMKCNIRGKLQPRFIVLTLEWLCNVKMDLLKTKKFDFKKLIWKTPLVAMSNIVMSSKPGDYTIKIVFNKQKQADILAKNKLKKLSKTERKFKFSEGILCRQFVFHLRRIYVLRSGQMLQVVTK